MITLSRLELLWILEQCGAGDWPYPLAPVAWPADTTDETVLARARTEDVLRDRGLLAPDAAATLLAVGTAVRDARRQVDVVRRSATDPVAAVALDGPGGAALLRSADHTGADVEVAPLGPGELAAAALAVLPRLPPAPGPPLEVPPEAAAVATRRRERDRSAVEAVLRGAVGWTQLGVVVAPDEVTSVGHRADARIKWLDSPRGRYRLRHDPERERTAGRPPVLVPDDAASPGTLAEVEALLAEPGRRTG
ncbi:ESX secretion-associated protein EspG [Actinomycetospora termitidis]|uniref:ESX secretion-associated protein EspG n=1 Tax=Actinomycetospora termitidis TaxID=3053470 RepID=A0ABT7M253_9PSEU|nr:ESX secretion-associated protein EspG [Actinomycetospora sp. Odt1-22]MDL5154734.1 ESX secretion-associated protein EspG [Actinomycetospora sp. Odt1-22]